MVKRRLAATVLATALAVTPLAAAPARAAETHMCAAFAPPVGTACETALRLFCALVVDNPVCRL